MALNDVIRKNLISGAKRIDWIDGFLGPATALMYLTGSEELKNMAYIINIGELSLLKAPFIINYLSKTKDLTSILYWLPKEIFANINPVGGFLDIIPTYISRVAYKLK